MAVPASTPRLVAAANSLWNLQNFRGGLLRQLHTHGFALTLAAPAHGEDATAGDIPARISHLRMDSHGLSIARDLRLLAAMIALLRRERPAALLSWTAKPNIYGALAARAARVPALPNVSGLGTAFIRGGPLEVLLSALYRVAFAACPAVFFQNAEDARLFVARRLVRPEQVRLIPGSGVDLSRFAPQPLPPEEGSLRLLFVGRLLGDKGLRELAAAAGILHGQGAPVRFQLLGSAGAGNRSAVPRAELDSWIAEGLVEHLGEAADVRPFLAQAHAVILPSYREGLPRSLLEAAAVGRPLLASDVPGCRDVVEHGRNGFLFPVRDADGLAAAIRSFLRLTREQRLVMSRNARQTAEQRFDEQLVIDAYLRELSALEAGRQEC
jgi:glycosyltransferase involved in cell wall biosynthesis